MEILLCLAAVAGLTWGALLVLRGSVLPGCALYLVATSCLNDDFLRFSVGINWSLDRLVLILLVAAFGVQWRLGRMELKPLCRWDYVLLAFAGLLLASAFTHDWQHPRLEKTPVVQHLLNGYLIPLLLYWIARSSPSSERAIRAMYWVLAAFGLYLALTALAEIGRQWWAVYPTYIANPKLGIHFGRARGPMLQSAILGIYLTVCLAATWAVAFRGRACGWLGQTAVLLVMPLYFAATWYTYTRICWIGMGMAICLLLWVSLRGHWRTLILGGLTAAALTVLVTNWEKFVAFQREDSAAVTRESTYMRASFAYVSWTMFQDHPLWGVGFGQYPRENRPYLTDRSTELRLESVRGYVHHNTLLCMLVEMGIPGLLLFVALLAHWIWGGWTLWRSGGLADYQRIVGLVFLAALGPFIVQMLFHDLSYTPVNNSLIYLLAGVVSGLRSAHGTAPQGVVAARTCTARQIDAFHAAPGETSPVLVASHLAPDSAPAISPDVSSTASPHPSLFAPWSEETSMTAEPAAVSLFGMQIQPLRMQQAVKRLLEWSAEPLGECRYVVTPNVDHAVMLRTNESLRAAYADAGLILADGLPVVLASRLLGKPLPERVAGSDLTPALFAAASIARPLSVFLLGAAEGVGQRAAANIERRWPAVRVAGVYSPPLGFEKSDGENAKILSLIERANPDVLVVGLGAPKQELWVHRHRRQIRAKVALCVGATIDFLAGHKARAPRWMQSCGLEWLHRLASEPKRLAKRYLHDAWIFPQLVWAEWRATRSVS